jgi:predicted SAM-dependent methyltransferase
VLDCSVMEPNYFDVRRIRSEVPMHFSGFPVICCRDALIAQRLAGRESVLDIGSGDRPFFGGVTPKNYRTMDIDRQLKLDFYSMEEISGLYEAVLMREVVEHLPREVFYSYLEKIHAILNPGGILILTTPNTWSPSWMLSDYTHVSHWPMHDMYAILKCFGFGQVEIYRVVWPSRTLWIKKIYWAIHSRFYAVDYAGSYMAIATKSGSDAARI